MRRAEHCRGASSANISPSPEETGRSDRWRMIGSRNWWLYCCESRNTFAAYSLGAGKI